LGESRGACEPLDAAEKRIITEWIDIGGPISTTPTTDDAALRGGAAFGIRVCLQGQPILQARCASCHQAFGGNGTSSGPANPNFAANRFVLTGNTPADFGVTATMVTNIAAPDNSLLLLRPSRSLTGTPPHPGTTPVLPLRTPTTPRSAPGSRHTDVPVARRWRDVVRGGVAASALALAGCGQQVPQQAVVDARRAVLQRFSGLRDAGAVRPDSPRGRGHGELHEQHLPSCRR